MMPGRRYSEGLHQALEAKEHVAIQPENQTLASITFQNYFRLYGKLAGMTGTALTEADEFADIYGLEVVEVPTNMPMIRDDQDDEVYRTAAEKYRSIVELLKECKTRGQPVLVGTVSIEKSEQLAEMLRKDGWEQHDFSDPNAFAALYSGDEGAKKSKVFAVLNARYHEQEAYIISQAGVPGAITIATNMAGRGTDIQLGGNADMRIKQELGDIPEGPQREQAAATVREQVARLKEKTLAAGGLFVLGTERHESRRIDNQLRGRSGRQGDPGRSKFFLSLEDDLMRIFGSDQLGGMLTKLGLKEGEAIVHPWINKALEKAQSKVEARNFDIRKNLLKYDNVMNDQRKVVFEQRIELMRDADVSETVTDMRHSVIGDLVAKHIPEAAYPEQWDAKGLREEVKNLFGLDLAGRRMGQGGRDRRRRGARAHRPYGRRDHGRQSRQVRRRDHALRREIDPAANARPSVARASGDARASAPCHRISRLCAARSAERIQAGGVHAVRRAAHETARSGDRAASAHRDRDAGAADHGRTAGHGSAPHKSGHRRGRVGARDGLRSGRRGGPHSGAERVASDPKTWGKVGRNEPCPCGSGKKYKHCHGRYA